MLKRAELLLLKQHKSGVIGQSGSIGLYYHVMHLLRLLHSGITMLSEGYVPVRFEQQC